VQSFCREGLSQKASHQTQLSAACCSRLGTTAEICGDAGEWKLDQPLHPCSHLPNRLCAPSGYTVGSQRGAVPQGGPGKWVRSFHPGKKQPEEFGV